MTAQNPGLSSNLKFVFGIFIMLCGWIICFDVFLLIIGIPFFLIGMLLVMFSKKKLWVKIITIAIPIVLWFVGFELILHQINKKTPVSLLIPENFSGQIRIVYGEKNGVVPTKENGRLLLTIPQNGILIMQPFLQSGMNDIEYYFVDGKNQRTQIATMKTANDKSSDHAVVLFQQTFSSVAPVGKPTTALDYIYDSFYVFPIYVPDARNRFADADPASYTEEQKNNPLTDSLVKVERGIK